MQAGRSSGRRATILAFFNRLGTMLWGAGSLAAVTLGSYLGWSAQDFDTRAIKAEGVVTKVEVRLPEAAAQTSRPSGDKTATSPKDIGKTGGETTSDATKADKDAAPKPQPTYVATISYNLASGETHTITRETASQSTFKPDQKVALLIDPENPKEPRVEATDSKWLGPILLGLFAAIFGGLAWQFHRRPAPVVEDKWPDAKKFNFHPLNEKTLDGYLGAVAFASTGIPATAASIHEGKYPLVLSEMLAYMSTLAYETDEDLGAYLKQRLPAIGDYEFFDEGDTQGFGFVFDGTAFIVMRGTEGRGDWRQNIRSMMAGPTELIPPGATWTAPQRHRGFAEAWDIVRPQVETWLAKRPQGQPLIFSGHSLGGALAFIGAYESAMQGRNVEAVITFGAPMVGRSDWVEAYKAAGLDERTLRLVFDQDLVPLVLQYMGYQHVGREWLPEKPPLVYGHVLWKAAIAGTLVGLVKSGMISGKETWREKLEGPLIRKLVLFMTYAGPVAILALAAHKMQTRYSLALSTISYQRIRQLGAQNRTEEEYASCYDKLGQHLKRIRGSTPEEPHRFGEIKSLPNMIASPVDLAWFAKWYPSRMF